MNMITLRLLNGTIIKCNPKNIKNLKEIKEIIKSHLDFPCTCDKWIHIYEYDEKTEEIKEIDEIYNIYDNINKEYKEYKEYRILILPFVFVPWMDESLIAWDYLCRNKNPNTIPYIEESLKRTEISKIHLDCLLCYFHQIPDAFHIVKQYHINWKILSSNSHPEAVEMLLANTEKIDWDLFSKNSNPRAVAYLGDHPDKIYWFYFCSMNTCPDIIPIMEKHINYINWHAIGLFNEECPEIIDFMIKHVDKIDVYRRFSRISNDKIVEYLANHPEEINWTDLSSNSTDLAIEMLKKNKNKISWVKMAINNTHPEAMEMVRDYMDKNPNHGIEWKMLFLNKGSPVISFLLENFEEIKGVWKKDAHLSPIYKNRHAIPLLKKVIEEKLIDITPNNIDYAMLWMNPGIFIE